MVDMQGMTLAMIDVDEESQQSNAMSEQDEDMSDYYNQPETLLDETENKSTGSGAQSTGAGDQPTGSGSQVGNQSTGNDSQSTAADELEKGMLGEMEEATAQLLAAIEQSAATRQSINDADDDQSDGDV